MPYPAMSAKDRATTQMQFSALLLSLLLLLLSASGCSNNIRPRNLSTASIVLRRTACFGTCPIYTVTLHGNGLVEYLGERHVDVPGFRTRTVSRERVLDLLKVAHDIRFWMLQDHYFEGCTDQPTAIISISVDGKAKEVSNYFGGCARETAGPQVDLERLAERIDNASEATGWIHCDDECLKKLIRSGLDVNVRSLDGTSLLMLAVEKGDVERVRLLLDAGAQVNVANASQGYTPLMMAGMGDNLDMVGELLSHGAIVNAQDKKGATALGMAGGTEVRRLLLQASHH